MLVRYSRPGEGASWVDVFVYPLCLPKGVSLANALELGVVNTLKGMQTFYPGTTVQEIVSFVGERNGRRYEALKAKMGIVKDGRRLSFLYLAAFDDVFVKIRFTQPEGTDYEVQVDGLAASLLTEFRFSQPEMHKHQTAPNIYLDPKAGLGATDMVANLLVYAALMNGEIEKGRYLDTFERSLSCWEPLTKGIEKMRSDGVPQPATTCFAGAAAAQKAGYLREYLWTYHRRPYWIRPPDLKVDEFKAWASDHLKEHTPCDISRASLGWK